MRRRGFLTGFPLAGAGLGGCSMGPSGTGVEEVLLFNHAAQSRTVSVVLQRPGGETAAEWTVTLAPRSADGSARQIEATPDPPVATARISTGGQTRTVALPDSDDHPVVEVVCPESGGLQVDLDRGAV